MLGCMSSLFHVLEPISWVYVFVYYKSFVYVGSIVQDCDNPPRKISYYRLNQSTLVIKK
jgi:hypothetical protein